jgi:hypothetical protein
LSLQVVALLRAVELEKEAGQADLADADKEKQYTKEFPLADLPVKPDSSPIAFVSLSMDSR